jgi:hypothetical protein
MTAHPLTSSAEGEVRALLQQRQKIEAIKLLRQRTGLGLKEAKDRVDAIERDMGLPPARLVSPSPLTLAAVVVITALLAWWWLIG